jgi:hypothetical protein
MDAAGGREDVAGGHCPLCLLQGPQHIAGGLCRACLSLCTGDTALRRAFAGHGMVRPVACWQRGRNLPHARLRMCRLLLPSLAVPQRRCLRPPGLPACPLRAARRSTGASACPRSPPPATAWSPKSCARLLPPPPTRCRCAEGAAAGAHAWVRCSEVQGRRRCGAPRWGGRTLLCESLPALVVRP